MSVGNKACAENKALLLVSNKLEEQGSAKDAGAIRHLILCYPRKGILIIEY